MLCKSGIGWSFRSQIKIVQNNIGNYLRFSRYLLKIIDKLPKETFKSAIILEISEIYQKGSFHLGVYHILYRICVG